jgi:hypothetical protein
MVACRLQRWSLDACWSADVPSLCCSCDVCLMSPQEGKLDDMKQMLSILSDLGRTDNHYFKQQVRWGLDAEPPGQYPLHTHASSALSCTSAVAFSRVDLSATAPTMCSLTSSCHAPIICGLTSSTVLGFTTASNNTTWRNRSQCLHWCVCCDVCRFTVR